MRGRLVLLLAAASLSAQYCGGASGLEAGVSFVCKWWSEAQMEGLNPNAPPPKNTEVKLTKWEYTDPIGTPHPDVVDAVVALKNIGTQPMSGLDVEIAGQWRVGPLQSAARAVWGTRAVLRNISGVTVRPGATESLRVPVDLKAKMDPLFKQGRWPHSLRITVTVRQPGAAAPLVRTQADLPIKPGD
jgi:hypothetical protein